MGISLQPRHLRRYGDIARLLVRYGRSDLVRQAGLDAALGDGDGHHDLSGEAPAEAARLADDLEAMGPAYVKLGQLLSTRPDLLPPPYLDALSRLQDRVEPFSFEDVERVVSVELGVRISRGFSQFDAEPLASASLGQVHRAALRDGRPVAVKVQRPGIREQVVDDMEVLEEIAEFLDQHSEAGRRYGFGPMVEEFRKVVLRELDYRAEAENLRTLGRNLARYDRILVPQPIDDYTSERVLTMDFVHGRKITSIGPLTQLELDGAELADQLFRAYLQQILSDGFFHADPHPGNVFLTDDGRLALIDLGMVSRVSPQLQECLVRLLLAVSEGQGPEAAEVMVRMGERRPGFDADGFSQQIAELVAVNQHVEVEDMNAGRVVVEMSRIAGDCGLRPPPALAMLGKALLNLDEVGRVLDPGFRPNEAIQRHAAEILRSQMWKSASQGNAFATLLDTKEFVERLPARVNKLLDSLANNEFRVHVDTIDERALIGGIQKVANRVTLGLILAAMIVGAAMLIRVPTKHQILGYPALAILLFLVAAAGGLALAVTIIMNDRRSKRRDRSG